jgi:hypothetical protein
MNGTSTMQPWKIRLSHFLVALSAMVTLDIGVAEAAQKANKPPIQLQGSAIMSEDDGDSISIDDVNDDEDGERAEVEETPVAEVAPAPKPKENKLKNNSKKGTKPKKRNKKREKLMEGFNKAEEFHKMWFHLPSTKIKTSLVKLTKFCKLACTASQCKDEEVANNCHLICPRETRKNCPDPLEKRSAKELDEPEDVEGGENPDSMAPSMPSHSQSGVSPDLMDSINQGENTLMESEEG